MKWNIILSLVTMVTVYATVALPVFIRLRAVVDVITAPPGAAFLLAVPFALCSAVAVFLVSYFLQRYGFTL